MQVTPYELDCGDWFFLPPHMGIKDHNIQVCRKDQPTFNLYHSNIEKVMLVYQKETDKELLTLEFWLKEPLKFAAKQEQIPNSADVWEDLKSDKPIVRFPQYIHEKGAFGFVEFIKDKLIPHLKEHGLPFLLAPNDLSSQANDLLVQLLARANKEKRRMTSMEWAMLEMERRRKLVDFPTGTITLRDDTYIFDAEKMTHQHSTEGVKGVVYYKDVETVDFRETKEASIVYNKQYYVFKLKNGEEYATVPFNCYPEISKEFSRLMYLTSDINMVLLNKKYGV